MKIDKLLKNRIPVFLTGDVDEKMLSTLDGGLKEAFNSENKAATIILTTHGGNVGFGEAIAERLEIMSSVLDLNIVGATFVMSSGVQIFMSLPREQRFVTSKCAIMIHPHKRAMKHMEGMAALDEHERKLQEELEHLRHGKKVEERVFNAILKATGMKKAELADLYRKSHRFTAKEAVRIGLATAIVS